MILNEVGVGAQYRCCTWLSDCENGGNGKKMEMVGHHSLIYESDVVVSGRRRRSGICEVEGGLFVLIFAVSFVIVGVVDPLLGWFLLVFITGIILAFVVHQVVGLLEVG